MSQVYVRVVHRWLRSRGKEVFIAHQELAPSYEVRWDYVDEGDLLILLKGILRKMEVKHRENMKFTDPYMFPFSTVIVNEVYKWDKVPTMTSPLVTLSSTIRDRIVSTSTQLPQFTSGP